MGAEGFHFLFPSVLEQRENLHFQSQNLPKHIAISSLCWRISRTWICVALCGSMDFEPREIFAKYAPYLQNESMIMYIETKEKETPRVISTISWIFFTRPYENSLAWTN